GETVKNQRRSKFRLQQPRCDKSLQKIQGWRKSSSASFGKDVGLLRFFYATRIVPLHRERKHTIRPNGWCRAMQMECRLHRKTNAASYPLHKGMETPGLASP